LDARDTSDPNKYALTIWAFSDGSKVGWKFRTRSLEGEINTPLVFSNIGNRLVTKSFNQLTKSAD
jgi:hypothetical protein